MAVFTVLASCELATSAGFDEEFASPIEFRLFHLW